MLGDAEPLTEVGQLTFDLYFIWQGPNFFHEISQFQLFTIVDSGSIENVSRNIKTFLNYVTLHKCKLQ